MADDARDEPHEPEDDGREDAFLRVVYGLAILTGIIVIVGVLGNLFDRNIHVEIGALGLVLGALTTLLVGKAITSK